MDRKAGDEVGGQRDEPAAPGDGVDEPRKEHERADDEERDDVGREGLGEGFHVMVLSDGSVR